MVCQRIACGLTVTLLLCIREMIVHVAFNGNIIECFIVVIFVLPCVHMSRKSEETVSAQPLLPSPAQHFSTCILENDIG